MENLQLKWAKEYLKLCEEHFNHLEDKEKGFITNVTIRVREGAQLSHKEYNWLKDIAERFKR